MKAAVILFPGTNCEEETKRACEAAKINADIVRWNAEIDFDSYDAFVIPGGWSYEDRIRAGIISSKDPLMSEIKKQAKKGKVVLGICNGCQVLVESGIIPGIKDKVEIALAPNINSEYKGFYCTWTALKNNGNCKSAFNRLYKNEEVIPMPIAHAEGRFVTKDKTLIDELTKNNQILFQYCDKEGNITKESNPNGSSQNIAGICSKKGNVLAMMPHPERAAWNHQLPDAKTRAGLGPGAKIFQSIKEYIKQNG